MGHGGRSARRESHAAASGGAAWRQHVKSGVLLLVAAVSLYGLLPTLASVFGSWRSLSHGLALRDPRARLRGCQPGVLVGAGTGSRWEQRPGLDRLCAACRERRRPDRAPGAPTPVAVDMLRRAGFDAGRATAALTASTGSAASGPRRAVAAGAGGDRRRCVGQPRPCQRGLSRPRRAAACRWQPNGRLRPIGRWSLPAAPSSGCSTPRSAGTGTRSASHSSCWPTGTIRTTLGGRWKPALVAAAANTGSTTWRCCAPSGRSGPLPGPRWSCWPTLLADLLPGAVHARWLGQEAGLVGTPGLAGVPGGRADRDAAVPAGRLLAADSRWRRRHLLFRRRYHGDQVMQPRPTPEAWTSSPPAPNRPAVPARRPPGQGRRHHLSDRSEPAAEAISRRRGRSRLTGRAAAAVRAGPLGGPGRWWRPGCTAPPASSGPPSWP